MAVSTALPLTYSNIKVNVDFRMKFGEYLNLQEILQSNFSLPDPPFYFLGHDIFVIWFSWFPLNGNEEMEVGALFLSIHNMRDLNCVTAHKYMMHTTACEYLV